MRISEYIEKTGMIQEDADNFDIDILALQTLLTGNDTESINFDDRLDNNTIQNLKYEFSHDLDSFLYLTDRFTDIISHENVKLFAYPDFARKIYKPLELEFNNTIIGKMENINIGTIGLFNINIFFPKIQDLDSEILETLYDNVIYKAFIQTCTIHHSASIHRIPASYKQATQKAKTMTTNQTLPSPSTVSKFFISTQQLHDFNNIFKVLACNYDCFEEYFIYIWSRGMKGSMEIKNMHSYEENINKILKTINIRIEKNCYIDIGTELILPFLTNNAYCTFFNLNMLHKQLALFKHLKMIKSIHSSPWCHTSTDNGIGGIELDINPNSIHFRRADYNNLNFNDYLYNAFKGSIYCQFYLCSKEIHYLANRKSPFSDLNLQILMNYNNEYIKRLNFSDRLHDYDNTLNKFKTEIKNLLIILDEERKNNIRSFGIRLEVRKNYSFVKPFLNFVFFNQNTNTFFNSFISSETIYIFKKTLIVEYMMAKVLIYNYIITKINSKKISSFQQRLLIPFCLLMIRYIFSSAYSSKREFHDFFKNNYFTSILDMMKKRNNAWIECHLINLDTMEFTAITQNIINYCSHSIPYITCEEMKKNYTSVQNIEYILLKLERCNFILENYDYIELTKIILVEYDIECWNCIKLILKSNDILYECLGVFCIENVIKYCHVQEINSITLRTKTEKNNRIDDIIWAKTNLGRHFNALFALVYNTLNNDSKHIFNKMMKNELLNSKRNIIPYGNSRNIFLQTKPFKCICYDANNNHILFENSSAYLLYINSGEKNNILDSNNNLSIDQQYENFNFEEETYANSLVVSGINTNKKYKPTTPRVISQVVVPGLFTDEQTVLLRQLVDEYVYKKNSKQPWALIKKHGFSDFPLITNTKLRDKARSMGLID